MLCTPLDRKKPVSFSKSFWPIDFWLLSELGCKLMAASGAAVIIVQFLLTVIHLITSAAGSIGGRHCRDVQDWRRRKNKQYIQNRMWPSCFYDSYPEQRPLDLYSPVTRSLAHWLPGDFLILVLFTGKLLLAFFFQKLLLLAFLWGENFCFSEGFQRGFVVLQCHLWFWCKSHLKLEAASSYSISCRAGLCTHEGEMCWGFWWNVHPLSTSIQCQGLPPPMLSSASAFQSALAFSGCWRVTELCQEAFGMAHLWGHQAPLMPTDTSYFPFQHLSAFQVDFGSSEQPENFQLLLQQIWLPFSCSSWIVTILDYNPENERGK